MPSFFYLVTEGSIDRYVEDVDEDMNFIVAFRHFLFSGQQSIIGIDRWDNPAILKLYSTAKDVMDNSPKSIQQKEVQHLGLLSFWKK